MSQQINLFNPVFLKEGKYFSATTMLQGLALITLGVALFYAYAVYQVGSLKAAIDEAGKRYEDGQVKLKHYTAEFSPEDSKKLLNDELKDAEEKLSTQNELIETLKGGATGNARGYSGYLSAFARQAVSGLWLSGFEIVGNANSISISGSVLSPELLPSYVRKLSQEPIMHGKSFAALQMRRREDDGRVVEFTLHSVETGGTEEK